MAGWHVAHLSMLGLARAIHAPASSHAAVACCSHAWAQSTEPSVHLLLPCRIAICLRTFLSSPHERHWAAVSLHWAALVQDAAAAGKASGVRCGPCNCRRQSLDHSFLCSVAA